METMTALEIKKALILLEKELGLPVQKLGSLINLYSEESYAKLQEASKVWNKFDTADIHERGEMLGLSIK